MGKEDDITLKKVGFETPEELVMLDLKLTPEAKLCILGLYVIPDENYTHDTIEQTLQHYTKLSKLEVESAVKELAKHNYLDLIPQEDGSTTLQVN